VPHVKDWTCKVHQGEISVHLPDIAQIRNGDQGIKVVNQQIVGTIWRLMLNLQKASKWRKRAFNTTVEITESK